MTLPYGQVFWDEPVLPATGVWARYTVYRQTVADTSPVCIAIITDHKQSYYDDYTCPTGSVTYYVSQSAWVSGSLVESLKASVAGGLSFKDITIHDVDDPTQYARLKGSQAAIAETGDVSFKQVAGNRTPVMLVGEARMAVIAINEPSHKHVDATVRTSLRNLWKRQIEQGATLLLRLGYNGERYFVGFTRGPKFQDDIPWYRASVELQEINYQEAVSP